MEKEYEERVEPLNERATPSLMRERGACDEGQMKLEAPKEGISFKWMEEELHKFAEGQTNVSKLIFPRSLTSAHRKHAHMVCERHGLSGVGVGDGNQRVLHVTREDPDVSKSKWAKKFNRLPFGMSEILDGFLWLGSGRDARDLKGLKAAGISHILNVTREWKTHHEADFTHHNIPIIDVTDENITDLFDIAFEWLEKARNERGKVLVHCVVGKSRSASIVIAYVLRHLKLPLAKAFDYVRERRPLIQPNDGFMKQLVAYEKRIHGTESLKEGDWVAVGFASSSRKPEKSSADSNRDKLRYFIKKITSSRRALTDVSGNKKSSRAQQGQFAARVADHFANDVVLPAPLQSVKAKVVGQEVKQIAITWFQNHLKDE